jgi:hypothetical protein
MTRLTDQVEEEDEYIYVENIGDWAIGDELAILATQLDPVQNDYAFITAIETDDDLGHKISLDRMLTYRHFGSTEDDWTDSADIDLRGEVYKLNRNIKIVGEDIETWGGQIIVQDYQENDGTDRSGYVYFEEIQVYNCSQVDTEKAAIRFELNTLHTKQSYIKSSAFHHGNGWALGIYDSYNIELYDNVFFSFSTIGAKLKNAKHIYAEGNVMAGIWERDFNQSMLLDARAGWMLGEGSSGETPPINVTFIDN